MIVWIPERVGRLYSAYSSTSATDLRGVASVHRKALKWSYVIQFGPVKNGWASALVSVKRRGNASR